MIPTEACPATLPIVTYDSWTPFQILLVTISESKEVIHKPFHSQLKSHIQFRDYTHLEVG